MTSESSNDSTVPSSGAPRWAARPVSGRLPDFPWDALVPMGDRARAHPDGIVDLSVGTPVDPTPAVVRQALADASDSPGYPLTIGTPHLRASIVGWLERRAGAVGLEPRHVLPSVGSKELIAGLATHLGLGAGDLVVAPRLAYPTYAVGAALAGARVVATDALTGVGPENPALVWINSPSNPTGQVLPVEHLRKVVAWCRERGALLVSDECYLESGWDGRAGLGAPPRRLRRRRHRPADRPLAVEALEPGRLPLRVRGRRPRRGGRADGGPQEPRAHAAGADAGRDGRRPRRRRPRRGAARALRRASYGAAGRAASAPASPSTTPRGRSTSGPPATSRAGTPWPGWPTAGSSSPPATSTERPARATCGWRSPPPTSASARPSRGWHGSADARSGGAGARHRADHRLVAVRRTRDRCPQG